MPQISVSEPVIDTGSQYRAVPFCASVKLLNASAFPAAYKVVPQKDPNDDDLSCLLYCAVVPEVCVFVCVVIVGELQ